MTAPVRIRTRGILFDMDGVLISSLGSVERSWRAWAERRGTDIARTIETAHGRRAVETIRLLRPDLDANVELKAIEDLEVGDIEGLEVLEGVLPILTSLPQKYWTIVTSATERLARVRLAAAGLPMPERIVTSDKVAQGKPHPEPYLAGARILGLPPEDCVVVEDSASGVNAGHAAGCKVLATAFSHPLESLAAANWIVRSLSEVRVEILPGGEGLELVFSPIARG